MSKNISVYNIKNIGKVSTWVIDKSMDEKEFLSFRDDNIEIIKETEKAIQIKLEVSYQPEYDQLGYLINRKWFNWHFWIPKSQIIKE